MQLAARRVLVQLERPLGALFSGRDHGAAQMAALVEHFLDVVRDGVEGAHATRTSAICLEQLLGAYGTLLFVQSHALTAQTPAELSRDLAIFDALLEKHCATGPFASRHKAATKVRAAALLQLLARLQELLATVLCGFGGEDGWSTDAVVAQAAALCAAQPGLTRELLARLLAKCRVPQLRGRKAAAVLDACEAAAKRASVAQRADEESIAACGRFFATTAEAARLGPRRFSILKLLELQQSARRWE